MPRAAWAALGALGAALATQADVAPAAALLVGAAAVLGLGLVSRQRRSARGAALWCVAGVLLVLGRVAFGTLVAPAVASEALPVGAVPWQASVRSIGAAAGTSLPAVVDATPAGASSAIRLWVQLPRYPLVMPGDRIRFTARATPPPLDDAGFSTYLARIGAAGTAQPVAVVLVAPGAGPSATLERLRRVLAGWLEAVLPEPQAGLAAGLSLGLRDLVPRDVAADLAAAGLSHVVAIDGWKVALVAGLLAAVTRPLQRRRRAVAMAGGVIAYALLAGAGASVLRAALMAVLAIAGRETGRPRRAAATLAVAVLLLLLLEPALALDAGFQLSASATAGLVAWSGGVDRWLRGRISPRVPGTIVEMTAVTLVAQAASLPLVLLDFGQLSPVAPLANVLVAPLVPPIMAVTVAAILVGGLVGAGLPHLLTVPVTVGGSWLLGALVAFGHLAATVPLATFVLDGPARVMAGGVAAVALLAVSVPAVRARLARSAGRFARTPRRPVRSTVGTPVGAPGRGLLSRRQALAVMVLPLAAATAGALVATSRADGRLHVTILDVGQGDAILVEGARGGRLLVDGGPDPDRLLAVLDARLPAWDHRLDLLVLTHPHEDHVGGLAVLLARYRIGAIFEPGMLGPGPGYHAFQAALLTAGRRTRLFAAGDQFRLDGAAVTVRWPIAGTVPRLPPDTGKGINDVSIVLDLRYGQRRLLLMGDTEEEVDPQLLSAGLDGPPVDLLKVAHHGSATASTQPFLAAVRPRVAAISVGAGNPYGHPAPATVARLQANGATVYRTDLDGSVEVTTDGLDLRVHASGGRPRPTPRPTGQPGAEDGAPARAAWGLGTIGPWPSPPASRPPLSSWLSGPPRGS